MDLIWILIVGAAILGAWYLYKNKAKPLVASADNEVVYDPVEKDLPLPAPLDGISTPAADWAKPLNTAGPIPVAGSAKNLGAGSSGIAIAVSASAKASKPVGPIPTVSPTKNLVDVSPKPVPVKPKQHKTPAVSTTTPVVAPKAPGTHKRHQPKKKVAKK